MRREAVIRGDEDVRAIEQAFAASASSRCPMPASTSASDLTVGSAPMPLACAVPSGSFSHTKVMSGPNLVEPQRQVGVDGVAVLCVVRRRMRRRGTEPRRGADSQVGREGELGMNRRTAGGRVIEHECRSAGPAADHQHLPAGSLQDFAERRRRQQRAVGAFGGFEVRLAAGVQRLGRVGFRNVDGVSINPWVSDTTPSRTTGR